VGQSFFPSGWAWWTGNRLRLLLVYTLGDLHPDLEQVRATLVDTANDVLRRFLNACRRNFRNPALHPVRIDPRLMTLVLEDNGVREALPEPVEAMFFRNLPADEPLQTSVNDRTTADLIGAMVGEHIPSLSEQLALDAAWLESLGEPERAAQIRSLLPDNGAAAHA
jgi:hypothetical protein